LERGQRDATENRPVLDDLNTWSQANAIRSFAVGRRNWLCADASRGARASKIVYSLTETTEANRLVLCDFCIKFNKARFSGA
jgi:hypothetical protein